jgi:hypothetical protein
MEHTHRDFSQPAMREEIDNAIAALKENGIEAERVETREDAKARALQIVPKGAQIMTMTSVTLAELGIDKIINESGDFDSVRKQFEGLDEQKDAQKRRQLGAAPDWAIGSVHAVTQHGDIVIASNTGSQLPAYAYGAGHVLWVVGAQKIVTDLDEALHRVYEHSLPLESERAKKAYGVAGSFVSKLLIISKEVQKGRLSMIIIDEAIGF